METYRRHGLYALSIIVLVGALITYKSSGALVALGKAADSGTLHAKSAWLETGSWSAWLQPFGQTLNYFVWVFVALAFGVVIGAAVVTLLPSRWITQSLGARGAKGHFLAALTGSPLMLCSCCIAPVFKGVYRRTRRLGPALGFMFAAPALNPAVLAMTFLLFPLNLALARVVFSMILVLAATASLGRIFEIPAQPEPAACDTGPSDMRSLLRSFGGNLSELTIRSIPAIVLGAFLSVLVVSWVPIEALAGAWHGAVLVLIVAAVMVPIALPTFAEIPIALMLMQTGAPDGAVLAVLVAGPIVNLPSLLSVGRVVSPRVGLATAFAVFLVAGGGGLLVGW